MVSTVGMRPDSRSMSNFLSGAAVPAASGATFEKRSPHDGTVLSMVARSGAEDVALAVEAARAAQPAWAATPPVQRGMVLHDIVKAMQARQGEIAAMVAAETGKSPKDAAGEVGGAAALGLFYASEGQRLFGRTTTSGVAHRHVSTVRQPVGIAGLIVPANTPIANVAWKVFPALVCGNAAVLKSAEDTPGTAWLFGEIAREAGLPAGVLNIVHGFGQEAGAPLVAHPAVGVISFTGSTAVGREIQRVAGGRLAKVSLELGGKNALVVCDDADLDVAVRWAALSAFSNAGQRCAAGSRLVVFDAVYEEFTRRLIDATSRLRLGDTDGDDLGPVINERAMERILDALERAVGSGARVLIGGGRLADAAHARGCYVQPTVLEGVAPDAEISTCELFGPVTCLYRVADFAEALALVNDSPYGLTAAIHTRSLHRATIFADRVQAGVVMVNAGTYGSEPHLPFGGVKASGNGTREPGTEALDVYSQLKNVVINVDPARL
jgi:aldehyde dehydrogenase (NAD+)